jgi:hypothetical protein
MTVGGFLEPAPASLFDWIGLVGAGAVWFGGTVGILCLMEVSARCCLLASRIID